LHHFQLFLSSQDAHSSYPLYISFLTLAACLIACRVTAPVKTTVDNENDETKQTSNLLETLSVASFLIFLYCFCLGAFNDIIPVYANESVAIRATPIEIGLMFTIMHTVAIPTQLFLGRLSDKNGKRTLIVFGMVLAGLAFSMFSIAEGIWQLILSTVLFAVGGAAVSPCLLVLLTDNVPKSSRRKAIRIYGAGEDVGFLFRPLSVVYVYEFYGAATSLHMCSILVFLGALSAPILLKRI